MSDHGRNSETSFPETFLVRRKVHAPRVADIRREVDARLRSLSLHERVLPGQTAAITAGSRGIANLAEILSAIAAHLKSLGAVPFVVPAMGSHGGATAEGQRRLLESYGVTESAIGCPIRSSMETVVVGRTRFGLPLHFDRLAHEADHVVVCNRVKPHTALSGEIQSGLLKMLLIGLGKCAGAEWYHRAFIDHGFDEIVAEAMPRVFASGKILAGVGIVENAHDETARIEAVPPEEMIDREKRLLKLAVQWMPRLPFDDAHLLLVDKIGKEISGSGMDTNVIGRKFNDHAAVAGESPRIRRISVRGLSPHTMGNAIGIGMAEFCRSRILREMDVHSTRLNSVVSSHVTAGMLPLDYETDREILAVALSTIGLTPPQEARVMWIEDTAHPLVCECSTAYQAEAASREDLEILRQARPLPLDKTGNLPDGYWEGL